jgi:hypothetical protein
MADRFQIQIVALVVSGAVDDSLARAASFAVAGSEATRKWWNTRNVPTAELLGDLETMCR